MIRVNIRIDRGQIVDRRMSFRGRAQYGQKYRGRLQYVNNYRNDLRREILEEHKIIEVKFYRWI